MKLSTAIATGVLFSSLLLPAADIALPAPQKNGGTALNEALNLRRTTRAYSTKPLTVQQISQLFWSGFGVNRADGKRTAPTARNRQEITLFLLTAKGAWRYDAKGHKMKEVSKKDLRSLAGRFKAPAYIIIVSDRKLSGSDARSLHFAAMDAGYVSQNIYLAAAGMKLGTCAIGMVVKPAQLSSELKLSSSEKIFLAHSVGNPK